MNGYTAALAHYSRLRASLFQAVPLSQGYGTHYANAWVGSPTPQRKTLIVDTGSHYTGKTLPSVNLLVNHVLGFLLTIGFVCITILGSISVYRLPKLWAETPH